MIKISKICDKNKNASKYNLEKIFGINLTEDNSYFNKVFRKLEGMTASDYKKKWKGINY